MNRTYMIIFKDGSFKTVIKESIKEVINLHCTLWWNKVRSIILIEEVE